MVLPRIITGYGYRGMGSSRTSYVEGSSCERALGSGHATFAEKRFRDYCWLHRVAPCVSAKEREPCQDKFQSSCARTTRSPGIQ